MPQRGLIYRVLVASPSDCVQERIAIPEIIHSWNAANSLRLCAILEPVLWESHATPELGDRPQALINKQLVENCDILVGVFWTRFGTSTGVAESGTAEEIEEFRNTNKPVLLYFSSAPVAPDSLDSEQYRSLVEYKRKLQAQGLVFSYDSVEEFRHLLQRHISSSIGILLQNAPTEKLDMAREFHMEARRNFGERDYEKAEDAANRSVELDPTDSMTWSLLGRIRIRLGKPAEAINAFEHALAVNKQPDWRTIYLHNRALARILNRDFGHARNDLNACVAENPHSWVSLRWRAQASYYMNDFSAALADAESSVKESPGRISNQAVLAIVAKGAGKTNKAVKATENAVRSKPQKSPDYYYLAALKGSQGDRDEALRLLALSIQLDEKMRSRALFDPFWDWLREDASFTRLVSIDSGRDRKNPIERSSFDNGQKEVGEDFD